MKRKVKAVITGDIIASTQAEINFKEKIESIAQDLQKKDPAFRMEISRGDTFQMLINEAKESLLFLLIIKAGLRRSSRYQDESKASLRDLLDARISLGIGAVDEHSIKDSLGSMRGDAFIYSGRALDTMKKEGLFIKISSGDEKLNEEFAAVSPLMEAITQRWTSQQAEAVYLYLNTSSTQAEIGKALNISQRGAGKRLEGSNIEEILNYNKYFRERLSSQIKKISAITN